MYTYKSKNTIEIPYHLVQTGLWKSTDYLSEKCLKEIPHMTTYKLI